MLFRNLVLTDDNITLTEAIYLCIEDGTMSIKVINGLIDHYIVLIYTAISILNGYVIDGNIYHGRGNYLRDQNNKYILYDVDGCARGATSFVLLLLLLLPLPHQQPQPRRPRPRRRPQKPLLRLLLLLLFYY